MPILQDNGGDISCKGGSCAQQKLQPQNNNIAVRSESVNSGTGSGSGIKSAAPAQEAQNIFQKIGEKCLNNADIGYDEIDSCVDDIIKVFDDETDNSNLDEQNFADKKNEEYDLAASVKKDIKDFTITYESLLKVLKQKVNFESLPESAQDEYAVLESELKKALNNNHLHTAIKIQQNMKDLENQIDPELADLDEVKEKKDSMPAQSLNKLKNIEDLQKQVDRGLAVLGRHREEARENNDFQSAAKFQKVLKLHKVIGDLKIIFESLPELAQIKFADDEADNSNLDDELAVLQRKQKDAFKKEDYDLAGQLQKDIENLISPRLKKLKNMTNLVEKKMKEARQKQDTLLPRLKKLKDITELDVNFQARLMLAKVTRREKTILNDKFLLIDEAWKATSEVKWKSYGGDAGSNSDRVGDFDDDSDIRAASAAHSKGAAGTDAAAAAVTTYSSCPRPEWADKFPINFRFSFFKYLEQYDLEKNPDEKIDFCEEFAKPSPRDLLEKIDETYDSRLLEKQDGPIYDLALRMYIKHMNNTTFLPEVLNQRQTRLNALNKQRKQWLEEPPILDIHVPEEDRDKITSWLAEEMFGIQLHRDPEDPNNNNLPDDYKVHSKWIRTVEYDKTIFVFPGSAAAINFKEAAELLNAKEKKQLSDPEVCDTCLADLEDLEEEWYYHKIYVQPSFSTTEFDGADRNIEEILTCVQIDKYSKINVDSCSEAVKNKLPVKMRNGATIKSYRWQVDMKSQNGDVNQAKKVAETEAYNEFAKQIKGDNKKAKKEAWKKLDQKDKEQYFPKHKTSVPADLERANKTTHKTRQWQSVADLVENMPEHEKAPLSQFITQLEGDRLQFEIGTAYADEFGEENREETEYRVKQLLKGRGFESFQQGTLRKRFDNLILKYIHAQPGILGTRGRISNMWLPPGNDGNYRDPLLKYLQENSKGNKKLKNADEVEAMIKKEQHKADLKQYAHVKFPWLTKFPDMHITSSGEYFYSRQGEFPAGKTSKDFEFTLRVLTTGLQVAENGSDLHICSRQKIQFVKFRQKVVVEMRSTRKNKAVAVGLWGGGNRFEELVRTCNTIIDSEDPWKKHFETYLEHVGPVELHLKYGDTRFPWLQKVPYMYYLPHQNVAGVRSGALTTELSSSSSSEDDVPAFGFRVYTEAVEFALDVTKLGDVMKLRDDETSKAMVDEFMTVSSLQNVIKEMQRGEAVAIQMFCTKTNTATAVGVWRDQRDGKEPWTYFFSGADDVTEEKMTGLFQEYFNIVGQNLNLVPVRRITV